MLDLAPIRVDFFTLVMQWATRALRHKACGSPPAQVGMFKRSQIHLLGS